MERSFVARNDESRERLRALVGRLATPDFARPVGGSWTVTTALAHLAFWDRFALVRWQKAVQAGTAIPEALSDGLVDLINQAALDEWQALAPEDAGQAVLDAAARLDDALAALSDASVTAALAAGLGGLLDRSRHRLQHVEQIERALAR